ncbi:MAG: hypothetical protein ACTHNW_00385 [Mucilaginibacter sp.]
MKKFSYILLGMVMLMIISACKKEALPKASGAASLTIVNAVNGSTALIPNFNSGQTLKYFRTAIQIGYGSSIEFGSYVGNIPLALSDFSDTTKMVYNHTLNIPAYAIQTLFLAGTLSNVDSFVTTDKVPTLAAADSLCAIRFVNLSPGSNPVSVDIQGKANGSEVSSLAYKSITDFKTYPAKWNISDYNFEIRDASSGVVLATYDLSGVNYGDDGDQNQNSVRNHSFTIAFYGLPGSQGAFLINNY